MSVANADMAAAWDGPDGEHWTKYADHYEQVSTRHWERLVHTIDLAPEASVVDVGCGTGRSTRDLARLVTRGDVLGIDLSSSMLEHARALAHSEGLTNIRFERADAEVHPFPAGSFDAAVSVFGAMFFGNTAAAFANICTGLKPGGVLALLTWRELSRNKWLTAPREALAMGRSLPLPPNNNMPGPFGLADEHHVRHVLAEGGFADITLSEVDEPMMFGRDVDDAFAFVSAMGITKGLLRDLDDTARAKALHNLRDVISDHETDDGVQFGSSAWLVTARSADL
jgi:SAM-dependent methyltransferase